MANETNGSQQEKRTEEKSICPKRKCKCSCPFFARKGESKVKQ